MASVEAIVVIDEIYSTQQEKKIDLNVKLNPFLTPNNGTVQ